MNSGICNHKTHKQNAQLQCIKGTDTLYTLCNFTNSEWLTIFGRPAIAAGLQEWDTKLAVYVALFPAFTKPTYHRTHVGRCTGDFKFNVILNTGACTLY